MRKKHKNHFPDKDSSCKICNYRAQQVDHYQHLSRCFEIFRAKHPKVPDDSPLHVLAYLHRDTRRPEDYKFALKDSPVYIKFMRTDDYGDYGTILETRNRFKILLEIQDSRDEN